MVFLASRAYDDSAWNANLLHQRLKEWDSARLIGDQLKLDRGSRRIQNHGGIAAKLIEELVANEATHCVVALRAWNIWAGIRLLYVLCFQETRITGASTVRPYFLAPA